MSSQHVAILRQLVFENNVGRWFSKQVKYLLTNILRQGNIPRHVAFIMDGNRRWARERGLPVIEGHYGGVEALGRVLDLCYLCGVKAITIYAFSIENFKRPEEEVSPLMDLIIAWLKEVTKHGQTTQRFGAKVQFHGELHLFREDVREAIKRAEHLTKNNSKSVLNVCFGYTSQNEMCGAIQKTVHSHSEPLLPNSARVFSEARITNAIQRKNLKEVADSYEQMVEGSTINRSPGDTSVNESDVQSISSIDDSDRGFLSSRTSLSHTPDFSISKTNLQYPDPENITATTISSYTMNSGLWPLDILIRTSGVTRLSDFMLWQCHETTHIEFLSCKWPDFDIWSLLPVLLRWQRRHSNEIELKYDSTVKHTKIL